MQIAAMQVAEHQKAADVWKKNVWDLQAFSQTLSELQIFLGNEGQDGKNLTSQTWPGTPRRPSPRHPRPPENTSIATDFPIFLRWPGDSQRELGRLAEKNSTFIMFVRLVRIASKL